MDDDGQKQRLLDVIGDPHALETFLETLPTSSFPTDGGLLWQGLDSPRFDNVTSSTDSGLVSSCLDNLVFDGHLLGHTVRGGSHPLSHPHLLQQVLPSPTLSTAPQGPTTHHPQQQHQQQQSQQHHPQQPHQQSQHPHTHHHQQNVALSSPGAPQVSGAPSSSGGEGARENDHPTLQQLFGSSATFSQQQHAQSQIQSQNASIHQQNAVSVSHTLPPTILTSSSSRIPSIQQASHIQQQLSVHPSPRSLTARPQGSPASKTPSTGGSSNSVQPSQVLPQPSAPTPAQVMSNSVQLVGGHGQVISSGGQIITSASQIIQGTQLLQGHGSTQVMPTGQLLPGGQVLHNGQLIQSGQVLHGAHMLPGGQLLQGGQVIPAGQVLSGGQLIPSGSVINSSQLISTTSSMISNVTSGLTTALAPSYVTPSTIALQQQQQPQQQAPVTIHQSGQSPASVASPFSVPTKSPSTALPRTSPSPSYHSTTPSPHPSVQSPAPYTTRSPAPSPHTNVGAMKSPAPTPSPAATPTPQTHTSITTIPQQQTAGMVQGVMGNGGMVHSLVPQLPLSQVMGSNGMVLPQTTVHQQATAAGVKQVVPGSQLIQIVSSPQPTQQRQSLSTPGHKPIQPKPQLLPKPPQQVSAGQPPPPPPPQGKSLISTRSVAPSGQQPIVIGTAGQPTATMMTSQQGLGGFFINPSPLQSGLQQPLLIQQPNGTMLFVKPSGPGAAGGAPAQAFLVPMPSQPQLVSTGGKGGQPQTVVFPNSGQGGPALVIPQNAASSLGAPGVVGTTAQGAGRGLQPIIRLVAPQAPLQLQPNGPTFVAVPTGPVNLSGLLAAGGATMRTLTPQGPLQLAPSSAPNMASMGHLQMAAGAGHHLQVSVPGAPLHLATSLPSSLPSVITTTKQTVIDESVAPPPLPAPPSAPPPTVVSAPVPVISCTDVGPHNQMINDASKNAKKKPKKKKKEKEPKDDKLRSKGSSINLNDILKETGIVGDLMLFDDNELNLAGDNIEGGHVPTSTSTKVVTPVVTVVTTTQPSAPVSTALTTATVGIPDSTNHFVLGTPHPSVLVGMNNSVAPGTVVINSAPTGLNAGTTMPSGMCFTLDPSGKVIMAPDPSKAHITASSIPANSQMGGLMIPSNQPQVQVISSCGVGIVTTTTSTVPVTSGGGAVVNVMNTSMPTIMSGSNGPIGPGILPTVGSLPSFTQLLTPPTQVTTSVTAVQGQNTTTARSLPLQLQPPPTAAKISPVVTKNQTGADISRVAQNTHLLQALHLPSSEKTTAVVTGSTPIFTNIMSGAQPAVSVSNSMREHMRLPVQVSVGDGSSVVAMVSVGNVLSRPSESVVSSGTTLSSPASLNVLVASQASQVPPPPLPPPPAPPPGVAVIASTSATNSVVSGAIISHKPFVANSATPIPHTNVTYTNSESVPISRGHPHIASALHHDNVPSHINSISGAYAISKSSDSTSNKTPTYQNEYVATLQRSQNLMEASKNKSKCNKKRKKDKEPEPIPVVNSSPIIVKQSLHDRLKASGTANATNILQQTLSSLPNGLNNANLKNAVSHNSGLIHHHPSITLPSRSPDGVGHCESGPVMGSSMPTVSMGPMFSPTLTTTATASVQTPPMNTTTSSTPTTTTTSHTHSGVVIPSGHKQQIKQVKTLILSQQNQEALKKVHNQITAIQHKNSDQEKTLLPQLYTEYRKIMATGKHYTVTTNPQPPPPPPPPSQPTPVRYSHPVGHKIITLTQFKQQIKHLPQDQQRQIMDHQSKPVIQRCREPLPLPPPVVTTTASSATTHSTTSPHISPTSQISPSIMVSRPNVSPVSNASMPIITTSTPSPIVPTTSTTVAASSPSNINICTTKMAPPQCSPVSSTTPNNPPHSSVVSPPKSNLQPTMVLPSQSSPRFTSSSVSHEHSPNQVKTQQSTNITKDHLFEHQLKTDQNGAINPEYRTPFKNKIDACKRLIRYHVYSDKGPTQKDLTETDNQFEVQAESILKKFNNMKYKYQSLLLKDSMRRHASSEFVMLYRLFVQEDKTSIERDKADVKNGKDLDLPPAPSHWLSGETVPPESQYPWEAEWENQKAYVCRSSDEEDDEETQDVKKELKQEVQHDYDDHESKIIVREEDIKDEKDVKIEQHQEEDFDDSQDRDSLHIIMGDEEEENQDEEEEEDPVHSEPQGEIHTSPKSNVKSSVVVTPDNNNSATEKNYTNESEGHFKYDSCDLTNEEEQELVICDSESPLHEHGSPPKGGSNTSEQPYDPWTSCRENDTCKPADSPSSNAVPGEVSDDGKINNSLNEAQSPSLRIISSDRSERDRKRDKSDKDKRKTDKSRDRERSRDREKEDRPPKRLKIKLKHEERAIVPPIRIRTEERGIGLKLTLKKQEGSEAYYSVGEERKRAYRVEQHDHDDDEEEDLCVENVPGNPYEKGEEENEDGYEDEESEGKPDLKEVKVVLEDVLKGKKFKLKKPDEERTSKRRKKDRSDDRNDKTSDRRNRNSYHNSNHNNSQDSYHSIHPHGDVHNSSLQSNYDSRTWNHNSSAEWTRSGGSVDWRRNSNESGDWQRTHCERAPSSTTGASEEYHRVISEGASNMGHYSEGRGPRDHSPPNLLRYNEHYDTRELSTRHNNSQSYGPSGDQPRNPD